MKIKNPKRRVIIWSLVISLAFLAGTTQAQEKFKPRFSLKLTGGLGYFKWGDINKVLKSLNEILSPKATSGEINELNNYRPAWEAEVRVDIAPKFVLVNVKYFSH